MSHCNYLFVYGTLRLGFSNHYANLLHQNSTHIGQGTLNGKLFDIGGYPGIVSSDSSLDLTKGDIFKFKPDSDLLRTLDEYEMCSPSYPEPQEYKRKIIKVTSVKLTEIDCWAYFYNWDVSMRQRIKSGDFIEFIKNLKS